MTFQFEFRTPDSRTDIMELVDFYASFNPGYKNYDNWVQKAEAELLSGYKKPIAAYSDGKIAGNLIWQKHKELERIAEIKNVRISPELRRRGFGSFIEKQFEAEAMSPEFDSAVVDTLSDQKDVLQLFYSLGYKEIFRGDIYGTGTESVVMSKALGKI